MSREAEIGAVKQLGEMIGYGNMMDIASALWAIKLNGSGCHRDGAFVPALSCEVRSKTRKQYENRQDMVINEIKAFWAKP
jgi:hypothetical protein